MSFLNLEEILNAVSGKIVINGKLHEYNAVSTDTRNIQCGNIFIALKGENFNGNEFVSLASQKGAYVCIVDEIKFREEDLNENTSVILVDHTRKALLSLAKYYRKKLNIKIIGVTGSTGKTSTKDLIAASLSEKYNVFKTEGNFNNEIGLPLMIFKLNHKHDIAILEMGMSNLQEIHRMTEVARPDVAVITNIGISHIENLKTRKNILKAKLEITDFFAKENLLVVNGDSDLLGELNISHFRTLKTGIDGNWDLRAVNINLGIDCISFQVEQTQLVSETIQVSVPGKHNVLNTLLAIAVSRELGLTYDEINRGLGNLKKTKMRLDIIKGGKFNIINDCYNASPDSMKAALDVLRTIPSNRRVVVIGTMKELGDKAYDSHKQIGEYAAEQGVDLLIGIGEFAKAFEEGYNKKAHGVFKCFEEYSEISRYLLSFLEKGDSVLVKASRGMKFEIITEELINNNLG